MSSYRQISSTWHQGPMVRRDMTRFSSMAKYSSSNHPTNPTKNHLLRFFPQYILERTIHYWFTQIWILDLRLCMFNVHVHSYNIPSDDILCYFVFPMYAMAVQLHSHDTLIFIPLEYHCLLKLTMDNFQFPLQVTQIGCHIERPT